MMSRQHKELPSVPLSHRLLLRYRRQIKRNINTFNSIIGGEPRPAKAKYKYTTNTVLRLSTTVLTKTPRSTQCSTPRYTALTTDMTMVSLTGDESPIAKTINKMFF